MSIPNQAIRTNQVDKPSKEEIKTYWNTPRVEFSVNEVAIVASKNRNNTYRIGNECIIIITSSNGFMSIITSILTCNPF